MGFQFVPWWNQPIPIGTTITIDVTITTYGKVSPSNEVYYIDHCKCCDKLIVSDDSEDIWFEHVNKDTDWKDMWQCISTAIAAKGESVA